MKVQQYFKNQTLLITCPDGQQRLLLCSLDTGTTAETCNIGAVVIVQDVTESKKAEEELEEKIVSTAKLGS